jgi:hypothetical protein
VSERIQTSLPDDALRALFCASEVAQRVRGRR